MQNISNATTYYKKSKQKLSALAHGHVHEQLNAITKGDSGIIRVLMDQFDNQP